MALSLQSMQGMRVLVLAAGLGTRLRPLTDKTPKPLVKLGGRPMIDYVLDQISAAGLSEIRLNAHYLSEQIFDFARLKNTLGQLSLSVQDESKKILGSGGALQLAAPWLFAKNDFALILNADNLFRADLQQLILWGRQMEKTISAPCTLMVMPHEKAGAAYTGLRLVGDQITEFIKAQQKPPAGLYMFPGAYVVHKSIQTMFPKFPNNSVGEYSIVEKIWQPLAKAKKLAAWKYSGPYQDLGTVEDLKVAEQRISLGEFGRVG